MLITFYYSFVIHLYIKIYFKYIQVKFVEYIVIALFYSS